MKYLTTILTFLLSTYVLHSQSDTIYMKNGEKYAVEITKMTKDQIQFERNGSKGKIDLDQVDHVFDCNIDMQKVDDFTGEKIARTKELNIGKTKMNMPIRCAVARVNDQYIFYISAYLDLGCISSDDKVMVKFEDEEILTLYHVGDIDCSSVNFSCVFVDGDLDQYQDKNHLQDVQEANLDRFRTIPISKIRLDGSDGYHDFDVTDKYFMINALSCLDKTF